MYGRGMVQLDSFPIAVAINTPRRVAKDEAWRDIRQVNARFYCLPIFNYPYNDDGALAE